MALDRSAQYPGRYTAPSATDPQGSFENETAPDANDKSYMEKDWLNDWAGFFAAMWLGAGNTNGDLNNQVDTGAASQMFDALQKVISRRVASQEGISFETTELTVVGAGQWIPPQTGYYRVTAYGGGGGGGGSRAAATGNNPDDQAFLCGGGQGGPGGVAVGFFRVSTPDPVDYNIGPGGIKGSSSNGSTAGSSPASPGSSGGTTWFSSAPELSATGGDGGLEGIISTVNGTRGIQRGNGGGPGTASGSELHPSTRLAGGVLGNGEPGQLASSLIVFPGSAGASALRARGGGVLLPASAEYRYGLGGKGGDGYYTYPATSQTVSEPIDGAPGGIVIEYWSAL